MRSGGGKASSLARHNCRDAPEFPMTKVLLLGLGRWGVNHLRNLNAMPVELYVAEMDSQRLEPARKLGLPDTRLTTNYKDWVSKVDCVIVVTPAQTHFPICQEFLETGKDVFVEKPITLASEEARRLTAIAVKRGRILQIGRASCRERVEISVASPPRYSS